MVGADSRHHGVGMVNIGDYADAMNATLEIDSTPGRGTQLKLVIPFVAPVVENSISESGSNEAVKTLGETGERASAA